MFPLAIDLLNGHGLPVFSKLLASLFVVVGIVAYRPQRHSLDKTAAHGRVELIPVFFGRPAVIAREAFTMPATCCDYECRH